MPDRYEDIRTRPAPDFLREKYGNIGVLLAEVQRRCAGPPFDASQFIAAMPTFQAAFDADAASLEQAFGVPAPHGSHYRRILQRLLLWKDFDEAVAVLHAWYGRVIREMPRHLSDIEESGGGRDILDPFIVAFTASLLHSGSVPNLVRTLVSHKCLMKLEDLIGHLHGEILGRAGGGDCVPEPQGVAGPDGKRNKEDWHPTLNPYPGADARRGEEEFYQIKNKTGSAKGSDGEKLGRQFLGLKQRYPESRRYYVSMIGRTLGGHRSMGAFLRKDPDAEVLVGLTAFQQLGRHRDTADIAMEFYLDEFKVALERHHYDFDQIVNQMADEWLHKHGPDPVFQLLRDSITPRDPADQSSATYRSGRRRKHR